MTRIVYHVVPIESGEKWIVSREGDEFREEFDTKGEAEYFARQRARSQQPSHVKVHTSDGTMDYESTYGEEPLGSQRSPALDECDAD